MMLTDCATQLQTAILSALKFKGKCAVTSVEYNNIVFIIVASSEANQWNQESTTKALDFLLTLVPTLLHWCVAHSCRTVYQWNDSLGRSNSYRKLKDKYGRILIDLIWHSTHTFELSEVCIHFALVIYITSFPFFQVKQNDALAISKHPSLVELDDIGTQVQSFISVQRSIIQRSFLDR